MGFEAGVSTLGQSDGMLGGGSAEHVIFSPSVGYKVYANLVSV